MQTVLFYRNQYNTYNLEYFCTYKERKKIYRKIMKERERERERERDTDCVRESKWKEIDR